MLGLSERTLRTLAAAALLGVVVVTGYQSRAITDDFRTRYVAGELAGEGESPYDRLAVIQRSQELNAELGYPFYDAPPWAAMFRAVAWLPLRLAHMGLLAANLLACGVLAWLLTRPGDGERWGLAAVGLLIFPPVRHSLTLAQIDLVALVVALLVATWQPVAILLKPQTVVTTVAVLFGRHVRREPWRALGWALVGVVVVLLVTAVVAPSATWPDWLEATRHRAEGAGQRSWHWGITAAGAAVLVWGARVSRRGPPVDLLCVGAAATVLLAAMGGWNPQWFVAMSLPIGALFLAVDRGEVRLRTHESALLTLVAGLAAGEALVASSFFGLHRAIVPVGLVAGFLAALVLLGRLPVVTAAVVLIINAVVTVVPLKPGDRMGVPMALAVLVLYLTFSVRPPPLELRGIGPKAPSDTARMAA